MERLTVLVSLSGVMPYGSIDEGTYVVTEENWRSGNGIKRKISAVER